MVDWKEIEKKANEQLEFVDSFPVPVKQIIEEQHGLDVVFADYGKYNDQVSGIINFHKQTISINSTESFQRQTFTMAHELGHWVLHKEYFDAHPEEYKFLARTQTLISDKEAKDDKEKEADHFAACLLMPKKLLLPYKDYPTSLLAKMFSVSELSMNYRLKNISKK